MGMILDRLGLEAAVEAERRAGKKIVFTNGCFDLIHIGHVRYLAEARALGDLLVVAVNSDQSVAKLKPGRPIIGEAQRAEVLASLCMVDYVTLFEEETPYELIRSLRPHILVKGGDWRTEEIVGSDLVPETRSLPFVPGISTTAIVKKIRSLSP